VLESEPVVTRRQLLVRGVATSAALAIAAEVVYGKNSSRAKAASAPFEADVAVAHRVSE